jgi:hypothetical protein
MKHWIDISKTAPRNTHRDEEAADRIFGDGFKTPEQQYIAATFNREQVIEALGLIRSIAEATGGRVNLGLTDILGKTTEEIQATFDAKLAGKNRRAGARAMVQKYGKEVAENIIARKTGKRFNLQ